MEAKQVHRLAADAMSSVGLVPAGRSRWFLTSDDLVWVAELDRGSASSPWSLQFGCVVREWLPDASSPGYADCHVSQDYSNHGSIVPPPAASSRFNDHRSYFTLVFDHRHDDITEEERREAFECMAADLAGLFGDTATVEDLAAAVRQETLGGLVHRRVRELVARE